MELLTAHVDYCRHADLTRYWFASVYAGMLAGLLILFNLELIRISNMIVLSTTVLIVFMSLIGVLVNEFCNLSWYYHATQVRAIAQKLGAEDWVPATYGTPAYRYAEPNAGLIFNASFWYSIAFVAFFAFSTGVVVNRLTGNFLASSLLSLALFLGVAGFFIHYTFKKFHEIEDHVEDIHDNEVQLARKKSFWRELFSL